MAFLLVGVEFSRKFWGLFEHHFVISFRGAPVSCRVLGYPPAIQTDPGATTMKLGLLGYKTPARGVHSPALAAGLFLVSFVLDFKFSKIQCNSQI